MLTLCGQKETGFIKLCLLSRCLVAEKFTLLFPPPFSCISTVWNDDFQQDMAIDLGHLWVWLGLLAGGGLLYVSLTRPSRISVIVPGRK